MPQASSLIRPALIFGALLLGASLALRGLPTAAESMRSSRRWRWTGRRCPFDVSGLNRFNWKT